MNQNPITSHILDTSLGKPAADILVQLYVLEAQQWKLLSDGISDSDGRINEWQDNNWYINKERETLFATYKIVFSLDNYWQQQSSPAFYPSAEVCFRLQDTRHHHIPLLLNAFGYSTYRGS